MLQAERLAAWARKRGVDAVVASPLRRAAETLRALAARRSTVLVVAHNTLLRLGLCTLIGLPVARYRRVFPRLDNGAVTEVSVPAGGAAPAALLSLNVPVL